MFEYIDRLPCTQSQRAPANQDRNLCRGQRCTDMRRHVVAAFGGVAKPRSILRNQPLEKLAEIAAHIRIRILLNCQRYRRVLDENRQQAALNLLRPEPLPHVARDVVEPLASRVYVQLALTLLHSTV